MQFVFKVLINWFENELHESITSNSKTFFSTPIKYSFESHTIVLTAKQSLIVSYHNSIRWTNWFEFGKGIIFEWSSAKDWVQAYKNLGVKNVSI